MNNTIEYKVKNTTSVKQLAVSIKLSILEDKKQVVLRAIGAGAVNQMYKALAIARSYVAESGWELLVKPGFDTINEGDENKTVMLARLVIQ